MAGIVKLLVKSVILLTLVLLLIHSPATFAAAKAPTEPVGITITPPTKQLTLGSGLIEANTTVTVTNHTDHLFTGTVQLVDFKGLSETGELNLGIAGVSLWKYGLAKWMTLKTSPTFRLSPGQSEVVYVSISNSSDIIPGGHYGAVVISEAADAMTNNSGATKVNFSQHLVSLLFVKKIGGEKYGIKLNSMDAYGGYDVPQTVALDFKSTGNVYIIPRGYVEVTDTKGTVVARGTINENSRIIIQGSSSKLITLLRPLGPTPQGHKFTVTAYYRYEGQADYSKKSIILNRSAISPALLFIGSVAGIAIIAGVLMYIIRKRRA